MIRQWLFQTKRKPGFRNRSTEIFRIEALSDAVFAFSVSILVASLEAPQSFEELKTTLRAVVPFFATVFLLFILWYQQYKFFRRYALNDFRTIVINLAYLAVILFYVYPLKFLFSVLLASFTGINLFPRAAANNETVLTQAEFPQLVIVFSLGYIAVWLLIFFMHRRALAKASMLELDNYEKEYTQMEIRGSLWNALVGLMAVIFAATGLVTLAGICFAFIPFLLIINKAVFNTRIRKLKLP